MTRTPPPCVSPRDDDATQAKLNFINAAYAASPLRAVEKYPFASVSAAAAAAMAVTVIGSSAIFSRTGAGMLTHGFTLASTFMRSKWGDMALKAVLPKFMPNQPPAGSDVNAVG